VLAQSVINPALLNGHPVNTTVPVDHCVPLDGHLGELWLTDRLEVRCGHGALETEVSGKHWHVLDHVTRPFTQRVDLFGVEVDLDPVSGVKTDISACLHFQRSHVAAISSQWHLDGAEEAGKANKVADDSIVRPLGPAASRLLYPPC
jgi:hypothetical protein